MRETLHSRSSSDSWFCKLSKCIAMIWYQEYCSLILFRYKKKYWHNIMNKSFLGFFVRFLDIMRSFHKYTSPLLFLRTNPNKAYSALGSNRLIPTLRFQQCLCRTCGFIMQNADQDSFLFNYRISAVKIISICEWCKLIV